MDSLIAFYKKNTAAIVVASILLPVAVALLYGALKSFWLKRKAKLNSVAIYEWLVKSGADQTPQTTDTIARALGIPKDHVMTLCDRHPEIVDAGKRKRSWKIKSATYTAEATIKSKK